MLLFYECSQQVWIIKYSTVRCIQLVQWGSTITVDAMFCIGNCMSATLPTTQYSYTVIAPSFATNQMTVTCQSGYAWNSAPSTGGASRQATCTVSGSVYSWVIASAPDQCQRMPLTIGYWYSKRYTMLLNLRFTLIVLVANSIFKL